MKPIYSIRFFVLLFSIVALVVVGCQKDPKEEIIKAPPPTPPTVFGADTRPLPTGVPTTPDWSVTGKLPQKLVCGTQYEVEVSAKESVNTCTGYNFQKLYDRAVAIATKRISNLSCQHQRCSPVHSWQIDRKWDCVRNFLATPPTPTHNAVAVVRYGVLCPNTGQAKPTDAPFPRTPWTASYNRPAVTSGSGDIIDGHSSLSHAPASCGSLDTIYIKYFKSVVSCQNLNYTPFITRAIEWAKLNYELQFCKTPPPCTKHPFRVRDRRYNCTGPPSKVDVDITYLLDCH